MKVTVEFKADSGETHVVTFDEAAKIAKMGPESSPFERNGNVVTVANTPTGAVTITLDNAPAPAVGASTTFSNSLGEKGTATILSLE